MRMPATAGVAFGRDQHMLAEGRKEMTTKRTSIRGWLAVRRSSHRPPFGGFKLAHRTIVPPLAATLAATALVGVGVALARNGRHRRKPPPLPKPRFELLRGEPLAMGLRRATLEQADLAIALLGGSGGSPDERAIHETRKAIKRMRALVRLLRDELGEEAYSRENASLRTTAGRLSGARDAEVMVLTLDSLLSHYPRAAKRRQVARLRRRLNARHRRARAQTLEDAGTRARAIADLGAFRLRVAGWPLAQRERMRIAEPGLRRIYAQGRARGHGARRAKGDRDVQLHDWRKRVKDLRYTAEALRREGGGGKRLRDVAKRADVLGETLGDDHDLALLAQLIRENRAGVKLPRRTRKLLLELIEKRRRTLQRRAMRLGKRLYRHPPKRFLRSARRTFAQQLAS
jgi:CHAD domain-containing protein